MLRFIGVFVVLNVLVLPVLAAKFQVDGFDFAINGEVAGWLSQTKDDDGNYQNGFNDGDKRVSLDFEIEREINPDLSWFVGLEVQNHFFPEPGANEKVEVDDVEISINSKKYGEFLLMKDKDGVVEKRVTEAFEELNEFAGMTEPFTNSKNYQLQYRSLKFNGWQVAVNLAKSYLGKKTTNRGIVATYKSPNFGLNIGTGTTDENNEQKTSGINVWGKFDKVKILAMLVDEDRKSRKFSALGATYQINAKSSITIAAQKITETGEKDRTERIFNYARQISPQFYLYVEAAKFGEDLGAGDTFGVGGIFEF